MSNLIIHPSGPLRGEAAVPGDKSITHRALILAALAEGETRIRGWVPAEVCLATLRCIQALGVSIETLEPGAKRDADFPDLPDFPPLTDQAPGVVNSELLIRGVGLAGLREPEDVLHCAGSGTTIRLLAGLLAGQPFTSVLTGSEPLRRRPMGRVAEPLRLMGATVLGRDGGRLPPLTIRGGDLRGIDYRLPVASAQVKSAILLAGLFAEGETIIREPGPSRDHTERMLRDFGVCVASEGLTVRLCGGQTLCAPSGGITIPADFSSAAFPLVAAALVPGSEIRLPGVGVNPTRTGLLDLLGAMGAQVQIKTVEQRRNPADCDTGTWRNLPDCDTGTWRNLPDRAGGGPQSSGLRHGPDCAGGGHGLERGAGEGEPLGDITVRAGPLRGAEAAGDLIVRTIDEFPIFAVAATQAEGVTVVREAAELRVKESDRIASVAAELRKMGAAIEERPDGMIVTGPGKLRGAVVECHRDHRLAMALAVAGLVADGETIVRGAQAIGDSFPGFVETLRGLGAEIEWSE